MASLLVIRGKEPGKHFVLRGEKMTIGRDAACDVQIIDHEVSRQHASIAIEQDGYILHDLASSNGTYVNGQRIDRQRLRTGDRLQVGRSLLVFTSSETTTNGNPIDVQIIDRLESASNTGDELSQIRHSVRSYESSQSSLEYAKSDSDSASSMIVSESKVASPQPTTIDRSHWEIMYRTVLAVSRTMDIDQLLQEILEFIFQWVACDRGCIMLNNEETQELRPVAYRNRKPTQKIERIEISKTILDFVMKRREGVLTSNAREDDRWKAGMSIVGMGVREAICVPMLGRYGMVGAIYIDTSQSAGRFAESHGQLTFQEEHLKLMVAIGHQAALAVEDTFYYRGMLQAERLAVIGQTIATLSHHIKNILQGLNGGSYLVEQGILRQNIETISKGWKIVEKNQERIATLVMDMLTFSKERRPQLAPVHLSAIVDDCIELIQARTADLGIKLDWDPQPDFPTLMADAEAIHRAILNVLNNAVDALAEVDGGCLTVRLKTSPQEAIIEISDNGPGIPAEDLQRIFSLFESSKGSRGTGLGLPVSQKILREHRGDIRVTSELGKGSSFCLILPLATGESIADAVDRPTEV